MPSPHHPPFKGTWTGLERTRLGKYDFCPRLAETRRKKLILKDLAGKIWPGSSWFWLPKFGQISTKIDLFCRVTPCEKIWFWTSGLKIVYFGPKQVSWTAWGASGPILASPSHLRVNFHYWVTFRVCRAPKIPNQPLIPFFVILLSFLHPKGWNKSTFDAPGPKPSINSKSQAEIATKKS